MKKGRTIAYIKSFIMAFLVWILISLMLKFVFDIDTRDWYPF